MSKKIFFLAFLLSLNFSFAQVVNGIAVIIENEPITMHEVYKTATELKIDEKNALSLLIKDRLEQAQIKNLKIEASSYEVSQKIEKIAAENGVSTADMRSLILSRGGDYTQFREDVAKSIKQEKLYQSIFSEAKISISPESARAYFEQNKDLFSQFANIKAIHYIAANRDPLVAIQNSPMSQNLQVKVENIDLQSNQIPPQLNAIFNQTADKTFTQIFQTPNGFEMFFVKEKSGVATPDFETVKNEVINSIYKLEQDRVVSEYFNKLRAKANIKYLR